MPQPIIIRHSTNIAGVPDSADGTTAHLLEGESAFIIAATGTKYYVGDNAANRLLLSTSDSDAPLLTANYAKLTGATFSGMITLPSTTPTALQAVTKDYVDTAVAGSQRYLGIYNAVTNTPDLTNVANHPTVNGAYFIISPGGTITAAIPGLTPPVAVNNGDQLVWDNTASEFSIIAAGGMTQAQADLRYLQLTGGTLTSGTITMPTGYTPTAGSLQVATAAWVENAIGDFLETVEVDGVTIDGDGTSATVAAGVGPLRVIRVDGGTF